MMDAQYPVETLDQIAEIPEDRLPAFLAELPQILHMVRQRAAMQAAMTAIIGEDVGLEFEGIIWVDDGAENVTVNLITEIDGVRENVGAIEIKKPAA